MSETKQLTPVAQAIRYCQDSGCLGDMDGTCAEGHGPQCVEDWCQPCLMQAILQQREKLRAALIGLVGVSSPEELKAMEAMMRLMAAPAEDKAATIDAIHALLSTTD